MISPHQINVSQGAGTIVPRSGLDLLSIINAPLRSRTRTHPLPSHWECDVGINVIAPGGGARPRSGTKEAVCENCVLVLPLLLLLLSSLPPARVRSPFFCLSLSLFARPPSVPVSQRCREELCGGSERAAQDAKSQNGASCRSNATIAEPHAKRRLRSGYAPLRNYITGILFFF